MENMYNCVYRKTFYDDDAECDYIGCGNEQADTWGVDVDFCACPCSLWKKEGDAK